MSDSQDQVPQQQSPAREGITFRAIFIGLILVAIVCIIVTWAELVNGKIQIGFLQMPPVAIGMLFFLLIVSKGMQALRQKLGLSAAELMMIYCMMLVSAMISSRGIMEKVIPLLLTPNYFANSTNRWADLFYPYIKKWMAPFDPQGPNQQLISVRFWERLRAGEHIPWGAWALPLACWGLLVLLVIFAFLCLAAILRRQWVDNEKLSFPLSQAPFELVREEAGQSILKNKLLWAGTGLAAGVFAFNGLHNFYPNIPIIRLSIALNDYLVNPPYNSLTYFPIYISFAAIGFFFLLPSDLLFSLWFFHLLARVQTVIAASYNMQIETMPMYGEPLFISYQTAGAYVVISAYLFYVSLPHLKQVARAAVGLEKADDSEELMPYRVAFWGLVFCLGGIVFWCYMAGMSPWVALLEFGVFIFITALIMARSTAEGGLLMTETSFRPVDLYRLFAPVHSLGPANMTLLAFMDTAFLRDQRGLLLTGFLDGLKISDRANVKRRSLLMVFVIGILSALLFAGFLQIWLPYTRGGNTMYSWIYFYSNQMGLWEYQGHMQSSAIRSWQGPVFFSVGLVVTALLSYMRAMFYWWPLHPLGYALCVSWSMTVFWFSCFMAWMLKGLILRYGGMRLYMKSRPWFLGMILGEFGMAVIWTLLNIFTNCPTPDFPWP